MSAVAALIGWLGRRPACAGQAVVGWRMEVVDGRGLRAGVRASRLGGPYEGPGRADRLGGSLELHWSDGALTRATLDRRAVIDPSRELESWRAAAVAARREHLPPLAEPASLPAVQTFDPAVERAILPAPDSGLVLLRSLVERGQQAGAQRIDAVLRLSVGRRTVATSRGFRATWDETACSLSLWADELASASFEWRRLPTQAELERLVASATTLAPALRRRASLPAGAAGVLFMPTVVDELLGRLLLPNLTGRSIRDGRSLFTRADLIAKRAVMRHDLDLAIDTTLPLELASAPCSPEGVPAGRVLLVEGGRLASPILDLATARELGLPPTPAPRGRPAALLTSRSGSVDLQTALVLLGDGLIVRDLPGLHTQQPRRATYALVAPDAQAVVAGEPDGRCEARIAGSLLDHLRRPSTRLVAIPGEPGVGLLVRDGVEVLLA